MKNVFSISGAMAVCLLTTASHAADEPHHQLPAKLDCGAFSASPKKDGPFTAPINLTYSNGTFSAERSLISHPGKEVFTGRLDPLGRIALSGSYEGRGAWQYRFAGQLTDKRPTVLAGALSVTSGAIGHRDCKLTILLKPNELIAELSQY